MKKDDTETRSEDPKTGGQKGEKLARFDLIPVDPLWALAEHYGKGAKKYADRQWEKGYEWHKSYAAMMRHLQLWWGGEDYDNHKPTCKPECVDHTESHHLTAVSWHTFALQEFSKTYPTGDDRPARPLKVITYPAGSPPPLQLPGTPVEIFTHPAREIPPGALDSMQRVYPAPPPPAEPLCLVCDTDVIPPTNTMCCKKCQSDHKIEWNGPEWRRAATRWETGEGRH